MSQDWMKFYFANPQPERFVQEVRQLATEGLLANDDANLPMLVFLSRVIAAHPDQLIDWLDALSDLPEADRSRVELAAWLSGALTAPASLADSPLAQQFPTPPPDMLTLEIDHPVVMDALWCYYFATGDLRAVRRIVSVLDYLSDYGAAQATKDQPQTEETYARALRDGMFQAASWSLGSLMQEYAPLKQFCGDLVGAEDLTPNERCALAMVLERLDPAVWRVQIDPATSQVRISRTDAAA